MLAVMLLVFAIAVGFVMAMILFVVSVFVFFGIVITITVFSGVPPVSVAAVAVSFIVPTVGIAFVTGSVVSI